jgi:predicted ATPase
MKLKRLRIGEFKNLKDVEINFAYPYTVLVGQNGSGKSNLYEALVSIFDTLECKRIAPFKYELEYDSREWHIRIDSDPQRSGQKTLFYVCGSGLDDVAKPLSPGHFHRRARDSKGGLLPELVFGYYSGFCERFRKPFDKYRRSYTRRLRRLDQEQVPSRRFLYGSLLYADLILVALWAHQIRNGERSAILEALGISAVVKVTLALQPPPGYDREKHDPRSMGLKGLTREFIGHLDFIAPDGKTPGDTKKTHIRLSDVDLTALAEFSAKRGTNLFNVLLQTKEEGVLASLNCSVVLKSGQEITYYELSEGEKQLLLVMGMMRFAEHAEALFLLDEPDTHLNPRWSLDYIGMIAKEFGHKPKSHIILATHDPLVLTELDSQEVQILARDAKTGRITVTPCPYPPKEMGVDGLLTSELFGLRAPIGSPIQEMINKRAILLAKGAKATTEETDELRDITTKLDRMGFANVFADPIYNQFVAAMGKHPEFMKPVLNPAEMAEQERFAKHILDEIMKEHPDAPYKP